MGPCLCGVFGEWSLALLHPCACRENAHLRGGWGGGKREKEGGEGGGCIGACLQALT